MECLEIVIRIPSNDFEQLSADQKRGRLISAVCELKGLTRSQLAAKIYVTPRQMSRILMGQCRVDADKLEAIANATGQPMEAFRLTPVEGRES